jgi:hypothetical protein
MATADESIDLAAQPYYSLVAELVTLGRKAVAAGLVLRSSR